MYDPPNIMISQYIVINLMPGVPTAAITANYNATVSLVDDDPVPVVSVDQTTVTAQDNCLTWTFRISSPANRFDQVFFFAPTDPGTSELTNGDFPPEYLQDYLQVFAFLEDPAKPISSCKQFAEMMF